MPWVGCVLGAGIASSVKFALLDGLGMLVLMLAVMAIERRHVLATGWLAVACLGRETNVLGGAVLVDRLPQWFARWRRSRWRHDDALVPLDVAGLLRTLGPAFVGAERGRTQLRRAVLRASSRCSRRVDDRQSRRRRMVGDPEPVQPPELVGITVQAGYLVLRPAWTQPWWRLGTAYVVLMALLGTAVWEGSPGALVHVLLPLTFAFNVLVTQSRWFWPLAILGNLSVYHGLDVQGAVALAVPLTVVR